MGGIYMLFITIAGEQVCSGEDPTLAFSKVTQYLTNFLPGCARNERVETTKKFYVTIIALYVCISRITECIHYSFGLLNYKASSLLVIF